MNIEKLDCNGLRCPQPLLKVSVKAMSIKTACILEVYADCPTFPQDIKNFCERTKRTLLFCNDAGGGKFCAQIQF